MQKATYNEQKAAFIRLQEKQIEVYTRSIYLMDKVIRKVVDKFDGKVINKRFITAIDTEMAFHKECAPLHISLHVEYNQSKRINEYRVTIYDRDNDVKSAPDFYGHCSNRQVDYKETYCLLSMAWERLGNERLNAERTQEQITENCYHYRDRIATYRKMIADYDECKAEAKAISEQIKAFADRYDLTLRHWDDIKAKNTYYL